MSNLNNFDLELQKIKLEYDISAYKTHLLDERRKMLEVLKNKNLIEAKIKDIEAKIKEKEELILGLE